MKRWELWSAELGQHVIAHVCAPISINNMQIKPTLLQTDKLDAFSWKTLPELDVVVCERVEKFNHILVIGRSQCFTKSDVGQLVERVYNMLRFEFPFL